MLTNSRKTAIDRLSVLINNARSLLANLIHPGSGSFSGPWTDSTQFAQWRTSSLNFLRLTFGNDGTHSTEFEARCKSSGETDVKVGLGILMSAKDDIESGYLIQVESLISADIFADFLSMAEHLQKEGYIPPAASLAGAVLEDSLKKICQLNAIETSKRDGIYDMNEKLAKAKIYNQIQYKNIDSWRAIRNAADHGKFDEFNNDQVKTMIDGIQLFIGNFQK